jgi:hypothetical protein
MRLLRHPQQMFILYLRQHTAGVQLLSIRRRITSPTVRQRLQKQK